MKPDLGEFRVVWQDEPAGVGVGGRQGVNPSSWPGRGGLIFHIKMSYIL